LHPGKRLRLLREQLGLTVRDVETASGRLAAKRGNTAHAIPLSRLSDIENKGVVPSIYRIYSLAVTYRRDIREILGWYGINLDDMAGDLAIAEPPNTHRIETLDATGSANIPALADSSFDPAQTQNLGRIIQQWGAVPFAYLSQFASVRFTYAYIGTADLTMSPLLPPGSFLQIDESRDKILDGTWKSEADRPIYFLETRCGYKCGWCRLQDGQLILQPHSLSPEPVRIYRHPQEAEVVGEVVGLAMQLRRGR
jgi:transcriptional regulator with XRE-family HTH domain